MASPTHVKLIPGQRNNETLQGLRFGNGDQMSLKELFGKRFEGSVITRDFDLIHKPVQNHVRREFIYISRCFYLSSVLNDTKLVDKTKMKGLEADLEKCFEAVTALITSRLTDTNKLLAANGAAETVHTPMPMSYTVPIIHPHAYQFVTLLQDIDDLQSKRDHAWMKGIISPQMKSDQFREAMKALRRIGQVARLNRVMMWKMLNRAAEETDGAEGEELKAFAAEQGAALSTERRDDPDVAINVSSEADLPEALAVQKPEAAAATASAA